MNRIHRNILSLSILFVLTGFWVTCGKPKEKPIIQDSAYRTEMVFQEDFDGDLSNWFEAGKGKIELTGDSALFMQVGSKSSDLVLWSTRDFSGNFQIEYKIIFLDSAGSHSVFFCARGAGGEDMTRMDPPSPEAFEQYIENGVASYQISCHAYDNTGKHVSNSRVRKNPGNLLLANAGSDPCNDNRDYVIDVFKVDNRIQYYVDGMLVHDFRDRGGFGPVYDTGKIGFFIHGRASVVIDDIRVFKLIPK